MKMAVLHKRRKVALAAIIVLLRRRRRRQQAKKRLWTHPWNEKRFEQGINFNLMKELNHDTPNHRRYSRMDPEDFEDLLTRVEGFIQRENTTFRRAISPWERLAITLRYLATGSFQKCLNGFFYCIRLKLVIVIGSVF